jgi:hypothetical protein
MLIALACGLPFTGGVVIAQDAEFVSYGELSRIVHEQNERIQDLETRVVSYSSDDGCSISDECDSYCDDCCANPGPIGGFDLLFLKPYQTEGNFNDFNFRAGYRAWAGYQRGDGLGVRFRWFDYFQREDDGSEVYDVETMDLEVFDTILAGGKWELGVGGGFRYLDYFSGFDDDPEDGDGLWGYGPVLTLEANRYVTERISLYGIARGSIICGDSNDFSAPSDAEEDQTGSVSELQLGAQWNTDWRGVNVFLRHGWEAQFFSGMDDFDSESSALTGASFTLGFSR